MLGFFVNDSLGDDFHRNLAIIFSGGPTKFLRFGPAAVNKKGKERMYQGPFIVGKNCAQSPPEVLRIFLLREYVGEIKI